jgi:hypothetical protein
MMTTVAFLDPSFNPDSQSRDTEPTSYSPPEDCTPVTISVQPKKNDKADTDQNPLFIEYFEDEKGALDESRGPSAIFKIMPSPKTRGRQSNGSIKITETKGARKHSSVRRIQLAKKWGESPDDGDGGDPCSDRLGTEESDVTSRNRYFKSVLEPMIANRKHRNQNFEVGSVSAKSVAYTEVRTLSRRSQAEMVTNAGTSVPPTNEKDAATQAKRPATTGKSASGKNQDCNCVQEEIDAWADNAAKDRGMASIQGEIKRWSQNAANDQHHPPIEAVYLETTTPLLDSQADKCAKTSANTPGSSAFPSAFERWETISSYWEGLMTYWVRRLEENSYETAQDDIKTQLSKQVTDLGAAGQNLFHAMVELQHLRASSERKFQCWMFETRAEQERSQEKITGLEKSLELAQQQLKEVSDSSREDLRELQIAKEEARRAWEEIGRSETMEKRRADRLEGGHSIEIGDMIIAPCFNRRADGTNELLPNRLQKVKKSEIPKGYEAGWIGKSFP